MCVMGPSPGKQLPDVTAEKADSVIHQKKKKKWESAKPISHKVKEEGVSV